MDYVNEFANMNIFARPNGGLAVPDGNPVPLRADSFGALLGSNFAPKYMELARRGMLFVARSGAAAAIPIYSTATNAPTLWNPSDSGKIVIPLEVTLTQVALASAAVTGFVLAYEEAMGSAIGTGAPFPTFTNIAPVNTRFGNRVNGKARFANATVTWTAQPAVFRDLGLGQTVIATPANLEAPFGGLFFDIAGSCVMQPGTAICVAGEAASGNTWRTSILFAELPLVPGVDA